MDGIAVIEGETNSVTSTADDAAPSGTPASSGTVASGTVASGPVASGPVASASPASAVAGEK